MGARSCRSSRTGSPCRHGNARCARCGRAAAAPRSGTHRARQPRPPRPGPSWRHGLDRRLALPDGGRTGAGCSGRWRQGQDDDAAFHRYPEGPSRPGIDKALVCLLHVADRRDEGAGQGEDRQRERAAAGHAGPRARRAIWTSSAPGPKSRSSRRCRWRLPERAAATRSRCCSSRWARRRLGGRPAEGHPPSTARRSRTSSKREDSATVMRLHDAGARRARDARTRRPEARPAR